MFIRKLSPYALTLLDSAVENFSNGMRPVFRPDTITRLAVRSTVVEWLRIEVRLILSTEANPDFDDDGYIEIAMAAVARSPGYLEVLLLHDLSLFGSISSCRAVAQAASRIVPMQGTFTLAAMQVPQYRRRLTHMSSQDDGQTWSQTDVSGRIDSFVDAQGQATSKWLDWRHLLGFENIKRSQEQHDVESNGNSLTAGNL